MDYDTTAMPAVYDAGRGYSPHQMQHWLDHIGAALGRDRFGTILDLGCGTGRFSVPLAAHFQARVIALDPSEKMLEEARRKGGANVHYARACAEDLPLGDDSVDLVFLSMVLHHFVDPPVAIREIARVLKPGGLVALRGGSRERIADYPYVPFFPETEALLETTLQPGSIIEALFRDGGLPCRRHEVVDTPVAEGWLDFAARTAFRADSILARLDDTVFAAGMDRLRDHAWRNPEPVAITQPVDLFVFARPEQTRWRPLP